MPIWNGSLRSNFQAFSSPTKLILYLPLLLRCRLLNLLNSSQDVLHLLYVSTFPFHALKSLHEQLDGDDDNVSDTTPISSHRLCGKRY